MKITLNIEPKPQSRPRFARRGRGVATYEDKDMKIWRRRCSDMIAEECLLERLIDGPIRVSATFYISPPQYITKTKKNRHGLKDEAIAVSKKPDLDNYVKALLDSISDSHLIWNDDGQVAEIYAKKVYSMDPRIEFEVERIDDD